MDQGPLAAVIPRKMDRETYRAWAMEQPRRFELLEGEPVAMNPERWAHAAIKLNVAVALRRAVAESGLVCQVAGDGFTVEAGPDTDFEPDALVNVGDGIPNDAVAAPNPVIVVEVLSRSTRSIDTGRKLRGYLGVPSIEHYLVVEAESRFVTHHRRDGARFASAIATSGAIILDPPGLTITMDDIYEGVVG